MSRNTWWGKTLRFIGIVLMALTGGFTLLGGIGTSCAAFFPENPKWIDSLGALAPFQWLYILFVLTGIAIGVWGIWATVKLVRGTSDSYAMSLQALIVGAVIGGFHIYMSRMLRGNSQPVDMVVYTTVLTLIVFLLFRLPFIWSGVNFDKGNNKTNNMAGGAAAILLGALTLTIQYTMGSTHTWSGVNFADAFNAAMTLIGSALIIGGTGFLLRLANFKITATSPQVR